MRPKFIMLAICMMAVSLLCVQINAFAQKINPTPEKPIILKMATFF